MDITIVLLASIKAQVQCDFHLVSDYISDFPFMTITWAPPDGTIFMTFTHQHLMWNGECTNHDVFVPREAGEKF